LPQAGRKHEYRPPTTIPATTPMILATLSILAG
jgi:hypothetical protein